MLPEYNKLKEHETWKLDQNKELELETRETYQCYTESDLRSRAKTEGIGSVRQIFSDMFADRTKTKPVEELILMRVICNYIAGMTDAYAQKSYEELYG